MAIINKTGITNGGTIQAEHITRAIDALSGVSTDSLILTGSMTGSLTGVLTGTASFATSASRAITASFAMNAGGSGFPYVGTATITGSLIVSGSNNDLTGNTRNTTLNATDTVSLSGTSKVELISSNALELKGSAAETNWVASKYSIIDWTRAGETGFNGQFVLPSQAPSNPVVGTIYFDPNTRSIFIFDGTGYKEYQPIP